MLTLWKSFSFWCMLPVRVFLWVCGFVFSHAAIATVVFAGLSAWAFWEHQTNAGGFALAMVGLLLIWLAEHTGPDQVPMQLGNPFLRMPEAAEA